MASKNYSYPRVTMSTVAKKHSHNRVNVPDTTILFAPLWTEKGPDDQVVKVHSLAEFIDVFGSLNEDFYNYNGQQALNVYNWLNNGGTLLVKRLVMNESEIAVNNQSTGSEKYGLVSKEYYVAPGKTVPEGKSYPEYSSTSRADVYFDFNSDKTLIADALFANKLKGLVNLNGLYVDPDTGLLDCSNVIINTTASDGQNGDEPDKIIVPILKSGSTEKYTLYYKIGTLAATSAVAITGYQTGSGSYYKDNNGKITQLTKSEVFAKLSEKGSGYFYHNGLIYQAPTSSDLIEFATVTIGADPSGLKAKYKGKYYHGIKVELEYVNEVPVNNVTTKFFNILIKKDKTILEKYIQKSKNNYLTALSNSEYISSVDLDLSSTIDALSSDDKIKTLELKIPTENMYTYFYSKNNLEAKDVTVLDKIKEFYDNKTTNILSNRLETPIDIILDAGYPKDIKESMATFVNENADSPLRTDIILILDNVELNSKLKLSIPEMCLGVIANTENKFKATNIALYEQYFTINDATFTGQNVYVTSTYFLSKLLPYNDNTYGMQHPTAGLRRGILDDALWVSQNPDADTKEQWFKNRINYVEKSSREYAFMSQRTHDGSTDYDYTALSFLNNSRVLEKMKKELESIGRSYLHEFNDAVTIANMTVALNKYVANWISNRTLSMGVVEVAQNEISENALDINLTIRFTNTIEVINVSIVIE